MIGRLRGMLISKVDGEVMLDVGGVGYLLSCSDRVIHSLPNLGDEAILHTELIVREDLMQLYGFASVNEREWFRLLTSVQGVGAKAAMAVLSTLSLSALGRALTIGDVNSVKAAPGIGPKIAQRVVNELKDKAAKLMMREEQSDDVIEPVAPEPAPVTKEKKVKPAPAPKAVNVSHEAEAISALVNLGYDQLNAAQTVAKLSSEHTDLNSLITASLRALAPKG